MNQEEDEEDDEEDESKAPVPTDAEKASVYGRILYNLYQQSWAFKKGRSEELSSLISMWGWSHNWGNGELDNEDEVNKQFWKLKEFLDNKI